MTAQDLDGYRRNHRKLPDVQRCGERHELYLHCLICNPPPPERPEKLQGPEVGSLCLWTPSAERVADSGYRPMIVRVLERSYVWAPGDPSYHGGARRYDWKVIARGPDGTRTLVVDDKTLAPLIEGMALA